MSGPDADCHCEEREAKPRRDEAIQFVRHGSGSLRSARDDGTNGSLALLIWLSPAFPVGAFAYSHGVEWAVEAGDIGDAASLRDWIADLLSLGSIRNDCILLSVAMRASDAEALMEANDLALALSPSAERRLETISQGDAFLRIVRDVWPHPALDRLAEAEAAAYPIALGAAAAAHGLGVEPTLKAFALAFVSNLVSASVRLGPIGQTDGQRIVAALLPDIVACARFAVDASLEDLGSACFRADIASLRHETQYSRLFRS